VTPYPPKKGKRGRGAVIPLKRGEKGENVGSREKGPLGEGGRELPTVPGPKKKKTVGEKRKRAERSIIMPPREGSMIRYISNRVERLGLGSSEDEARKGEGNRHHQPSRRGAAVQRKKG